MMPSTTKTTTAAEVLAELKAAIAATSAAHVTDDDGTIATAYAHEADLWQQLLVGHSLYAENDPVVLRELLWRAAAGARAHNREVAHRYRSWAATAT